MWTTDQSLQIPPHSHLLRASASLREISYPTNIAEEENHGLN